jgi:hypothetical protein
MNEYTLYVTSVESDERNQQWQEITNIDEDRIEADTLEEAFQDAKENVREWLEDRVRDDPAATPYDVAAWWCRYILPAGGVLCDPMCGWTTAHPR